MGKCLSGFLALVLLGACATPQKYSQTTLASREVALVRNVAADSQQSWEANIAFGPSIPKQDDKLGVTPNNTNFQTKGPLRDTGGEIFVINYVDREHKTNSALIRGIRLVGFSKSGKGKILVRHAGSLPQLASGTFDPMFIFDSIGKGSSAQKYEDGHVLLPNNSAVGLNFDKPVDLQAINFQLEGFGDDDASVLVQFIYEASSPAVAEIITRVPAVHTNPGNGGSGGTGSPECIRATQCTAQQNCIGGQCVTVDQHNCNEGAANACQPTESCCPNGKCVPGICNGE